METVNVILKKVAVTGFQPRTQEVQLSISFDDGKEKEIFKEVEAGKSDEAAASIIMDIRQMEKMAKGGIDEKDSINVKIHDEDKTSERLGMFLSKVFEKSKIIKSYKSSDGYMSLISGINRMELKF